MPTDTKLIKSIRLSASKTPDPERAERNLASFLDNVENTKPFLGRIEEIALLMSHSRFLASFCIRYPDALLYALDNMKTPITQESLALDAINTLAIEKEIDAETAMKRLRVFKKRHLLQITLRDLTGLTDTPESMEELTLLAEKVMDGALQFGVRLTERRFGEPPAGAKLCLIALGKMGGEELNYSSDVDFIAVFPNYEDDAQTTGSIGPTGVLMNRIGVEEFYYKVVETMNKLLSSNTEDGIAYRVDLRLRPQGSKGEIAMPLASYRTYYESWGRTWERMVLIRARPVVGDMDVGREYMRLIEPFVWRTSLDSAEIDEVRALKKKIDSTFSRDDIKRGWGGIREAEFFVQTFQMIYGGENPDIRTNRLANAVQTIGLMQLVPEDELACLINNYMHLRKLEHFLQMLDDLQTHELPKSESELSVLSKKMGFRETREFQSDLMVRRLQIKNMYNALLGTQEDINAETLTLIEGDLGDEELKGFLSFRKVRRPEEGLASIRRIRDAFQSASTAKERSLLRTIAPRLLEDALHSASPDRAMSGLGEFLFAFGSKEAYLTALIEEASLRDGLVKLFSMSAHLTRLFIGSHRYLDLLIEEGVIRKSFSSLSAGISRYASSGDDAKGLLVEYKTYEEIRLGIFFLLGVFGSMDLHRYLSHVADVSLEISRRSTKADDLSVIAMGKLGGREITYGSDLDILLVCQNPDGFVGAERFMKSVTSYTDKGVLYSIDLRLRPEGTKGLIVNDIAEYENYYLHKALPWEIQALLKARPAAGDGRVMRAFMDMTRRVISTRAPGILKTDIDAMRLRIMKELSKEDEGTDIKLGPGGIGEIEFLIQRLIITNVINHPRILVQNTASAIHRLGKAGIITPPDVRLFLDAYSYFRTIETLLRLNNERVLKEDSPSIESYAVFMGYKDKGALLERVIGLRKSVIEATERYYK